ncbi:MAG: DUF2911 domain-containing protein [Ferruginibacter sp.]
MKCIVTLFFLCLGNILWAQDNVPAMDKSPLDVSYFPVNYPVLKIQDKASETPVARIIYSRPQKNGRQIFGNLVEYGKVWRLGANEATELEFFQSVSINNSKIKKGRYTLYVIPDSSKWTIILNKENDTWGSFRYDEKKDVLRYSLPVIAQPESVETMYMFFDKKDTANFTLNMGWENVHVALPIQIDM